MSSVFWRRVADYTQRSITITLAGLTVLGLVVLAQEGQGVVYRYKQGKALKANTASQDSQVSCQTNPSPLVLNNFNIHPLNTIIVKHNISLQMHYTRFPSFSSPGIGQ